VTESIPTLRVDRLDHREEFDALIENERDLRKREFYRFIGAQALYAVSTARDELRLDMRAVAALAERMFDRNALLARILSGDAHEHDW